MPAKDIRLDENDDCPDFMDKLQRCKNPECKGLSFFKCSKCGTAMCLNESKNCFLDFHTKR